MGGHSGPPLGASAPNLRGVQDVLEPVAIIGFSVKFPGEAASPEAFWNMISEKRCASSIFPQSRVNIEAFHHPDTTRLDSVPLRNGHFLEEDLGAFDHHFFSITPSEAMAMDPQHRGLLETSYRALENAGIPLHKIDGTSAGVFTGSFGDDYRIGTLKDVACMPKHAAVGLGQNFTANRLSWAFNLKGPSLQIDTACSSSLIALDMACQSIRAGDTSVALVCGSNVISSIEMFMALSNMGFLSPDGKCYSFDHRANGYARGEGFGVLVVKRLSDAIADGDTVRAVIRSSGSNQNGRTRSITQTSKADQVELMRNTYAKAGLDLKSTRFVEAHGTGTALGDPVEAGAIGEVFGSHHTPDDPVYIGAVKSNIGHLEGASGIAGIVKAVLAVEKGIIPPNTNFQRLNPKIKAKALNLQFPTTSIPWPTQGLRRASINSFGYGGSNAHVVIDDAFNYMRERDLQGLHNTAERPPLLLENGSLMITSPASAASTDSGIELQNCFSNQSAFRPPQLLVFSAANEHSVEQLSTTFCNYYRNSESPTEYFPNATYLHRLAYTLSSHRSRFPCRSFAVISDPCQLKCLGDFVTKPVRSSSKLGLCGVFTGQGAQSAGMGKELMAYPAFRESLENADHILAGLGCEWSVTEELLKSNETSRINNPDFSQPLCTILQVAIVDLLRTCGLQPAVVVGHSSGEIAAAYSTGALSMASACRVAYYRGKYGAALANSTTRNGGMIAVGLSQAEVERYVAQVDSSSQLRLVVACINSPKSVTVSGDLPGIDMLKSLLDKDGVFNRKLKVDLAYHSHHMQDIAQEYAESLTALERGDSVEPRPVMVSSVTGEVVSIDAVSERNYWVQNLVSPVRFSDALAVAFGSHSSGAQNQKNRRSQTPAVYHTLEIGPSSTLRGPIRETLTHSSKGKDFPYFSALKRDTPADESLLNAVGGLWAVGYELNVVPLNLADEDSPPLEKPLVDLPEYTFDHRQSFFHLPTYQKDFLFREFPRVDLLGTQVLGWNPMEPIWRNIIRISEMPWVEDHVVNNTVLYPAAGMLMMGIEAARRMAPTDRKLKGVLVREAIFSHSLPISGDEDGVETRLHLKPQGSHADPQPDTFDFALYSLLSGQWIRNCSGSVVLEFSQEDPIRKGSVPVLEHPKVISGQAMAKEQVYEDFRKAGLQYGPAFQALTQVSYGEDAIAVANMEAYSPPEGPHSTSKQAYIIHPTTLDALAQVALVCLTRGGKVLVPTNVPTALRGLWISADRDDQSEAVRITAYAKALFHSDRQNEFSITAVDENSGQTLVSLACLETTNVGGTVEDTELREEQQCYVIESKPDVDFLDNESAKRYCIGESTNQLPDSGYPRALERYMIGMFKTIIKEMDPSKIAQLPAHHRKYFDWARRRVKQFEATACSGELGTVSNAEALESLRSRVEAAGHEGRFYSELGKNLVQILRGDVDPLGILFEGDIATNLYRELNERISKPLTTLVRLLAHKNPNMKVLEIGAGTAGTSRVVLDAFQHPLRSGKIGTRFERFDYTDISPSFFESAKQLFSAYAEKMNFMTLDIEKDLKDQGFEPQSYDLIFAANVLHATHSLHSTLRNVRSLLKPGGKLVLVEVTNNFQKAGFGMGLLPGWWLSIEEFRKDGPCIPESSWHDVLSETGFSGLDFALPDYDDSHHELSVVVSTAVATEENLDPYPVVILYDDTVPSQCILSQYLRRTINEETNSTCSHRPIHRVQSKELERAYIISIVEVNHLQMCRLTHDIFLNIQAIISQAKAIVWVASSNSAEDSPSAAMVDGLRRVVTSENPDLRFVTLNLGQRSDSTNYDADAVAALVLKVYKKTMAGSVNGVEGEFRLGKGELLYTKRLTDAGFLNYHIDRHTQAPQAEERNFGASPTLVVDFAYPGVMDSLRFIEDQRYGKDLADDELEIKVEASGMVFRDCLLALGRIKGPVNSIGAEFAGTVLKAGSDAEYKVGDSLYGFTTTGSFSSVVRTKSALVAPMPGDLTFTEAAGLPTAYATVLHALVNVAQLEEGESILIHSAAGGTGQAAVQVARHLKAEIYATVGTENKKELLMEQYGIPEDHIFSSRSTRFEKQLKHMTKGRGVDVVLNSLSGQKLTASWECIAPYGRFIEIGKRDIMTNSKLPMLPFLKNVSFCTVDLYSMLREKPLKVKKLLLNMNDMVEKKHIQPLFPNKVFTVSKLEAAFREMQSGTNSGKIVVEMRQSDVVKTLLPVRPTWAFDPNASYLIAGGFGGVARSIARWMASRGARNLILLSRSGVVPDSKAAELVEELTHRGVRVECPRCDVSSAIELEQALDHCRNVRMPKIKGCIQGSMVLRDAIFTNMSFTDWQAVLAPRIQGTWNLHNQLPSQMSFFVMLSSVAGIAGTAGQANYATSNTFLDEFACYRLSLGEKATSIDLGWVESDGTIAENEQLQRFWKAVGCWVPVKSDELFALLDWYCDPDIENLNPETCQAAIGIGTPALMRKRGIEEVPVFMQRPMFRSLYRLEDASASASGSSSADDSSAGHSNTPDFATLYTRSESTPEAASHVTAALVHRVAKAMAMPPENVDPAKPLHAYGVDSLLGIELRTWFKKLFAVEVGVFEILGARDFAALGERVVVLGGRWG